MKSGAPKPTVSVILPTYNRQPLLRQAIDSVVGQSFRDWELIVADDGSSDGTRQYLTGLGDPRIRPIFLDRSGNPARARRAALGVASGTWVAFLDSDDLWLPNKLAIQLADLAAHPECQWGYTGYHLIDVDGKEITFRPQRQLRLSSGWILAQLLTFEVSAAIQTLVVRRSLLDEVGGFDESLATHEDYDLTLQLAARSEAYATPATLSLVRDHPDRTTSGRRPAELFAASERVFRKARARATNEIIRTLCARQAALQLARMATALSREGRHAAAVRALVHAFQNAPLGAAVWRAAASCAFRALRLKV